MHKTKLIKYDRILNGVLAGFSYTLGIQTWILRTLFVIAAFYIGFFPLFLIYLLLASLIPEYEQDPKDYDEICK